MKNYSAQRPSASTANRGSQQTGTEAPEPLDAAPCCASGPLLDLEFVAWQRILKEKGYSQTSLTRDQMVESLETLLNWAQTDAPAESPQNTQLLSVEPRQRIAIIQKWIAQWRDGTHEPLAVGKTSERTSQ